MLLYVKRTSPYETPPQPYLARTAPPIVWMIRSTGGAPCSPSPRTTIPHPNSTHGSMGGSHRGTDTFTPKEPGPCILGIRRHLDVAVHSCYPQPRGSTAFRAAEISDVRWAVGPLRPSDALSANHGSPDKERCPYVQGILVQLSRSNPVVVPSPCPKLDKVLSLIIREIHFPVYVLSATKTECHQSVSHADGEIRDHLGWATLLQLDFVSSNTTM